ncbi:LOW QUALITY PROTEIN: uncharacterized protein LOC119584811 [Penaeus monodon]|uniref:LOW QUALITY PROTEIN: uncharacterized protein LOC119584811 n=1 Tax=Penaeus monodon TaxID=6687 RepID=UPI0018A71CB3|nr:LOW QUALITY PROTEIN: uncharacterized protein LOC119584811 [Penaeus monodon]
MRRRLAGEGCVQARRGGAGYVQAGSPLIGGLTLAPVFAMELELLPARALCSAMYTQGVLRAVLLDVPCKVLCSTSDINTSASSRDMFTCSEPHQASRGLRAQKGVWRPTSANLGSLKWKGSRPETQVGKFANLDTKNASARSMCLWERRESRRSTLPPVLSRGGVSDADGAEASVTAGFMGVRKHAHAATSDGRAPGVAEEMAATSKMKTNKKEKKSPVYWLMIRSLSRACRRATSTCGAEWLANARRRPASWSHLPTRNSPAAVASPGSVDQPAARSDCLTRKPLAPHALPFSLTPLRSSPFSVTGSRRPRQNLLQESGGRGGLLRYHLQPPRVQGWQGAEAHGPEENVSGGFRALRLRAPRGRHQVPGAVHGMPTAFGGRARGSGRAPGRRQPARASAHPGDQPPAAPPPPPPPPPPRSVRVDDPAKDDPSFVLAAQQHQHHLQQLQHQQQHHSHQHPQHKQQYPLLQHHHHQQQQQQEQQHHHHHQHQHLHPQQKQQPSPRQQEREEKEKKEREEREEDEEEGGRGQKFDQRVSVVSHEVDYRIPITNIYLKHCSNNLNNNTLCNNYNTQYNSVSPRPWKDGPIMAESDGSEDELKNTEVERKVETRTSSEWTPYQHQPLGLSRSDVPRRSPCPSPSGSERAATATPLDTASNAEDTSSNGNKDDEDDDADDDNDDDKIDAQYDPERLKAFNMFVRLFVDENLDRIVPISKQPKEKIQAIIDACARQFPEFAERTRKRIRTYLKSCRRNKRTRDSNGWETPSRPTPPHLTPGPANACENEAQNAKRMRLGLEPIAQPNPLNPLPQAPMGQDKPMALVDTVVKTESSAPPHVSALAKALERPLADAKVMNGSSMFQASFQQSFQKVTSLTGFNCAHPARPDPAHSHHVVADAGQWGPVALGSWPTDLSVKGTSKPTRPTLNAVEVAAVRQLITGYRESAAFLLRSADELENLLIHQQSP